MSLVRRASALTQSGCTRSIPPIIPIQRLTLRAARKPKRLYRHIYCGDWPKTSREKYLHLSKLHHEQPQCAKSKPLQHSQNASFYPIWFSRFDKHRSCSLDSCRRRLYGLRASACGPAERRAEGEYTALLFLQNDMTCCLRWRQRLSNADIYLNGSPKNT